MIIKIIYSAVVVVYGLLLIFASVKNTESTKKTLPSRENILMITGSLLTLLSFIAALKLYFPYVILLVFGLVLIHTASILNGYKIHRKLNLSHHIVKLVISAVIVLLFCVINL